MAGAAAAASSTSRFLAWRHLVRLSFLRQWRSMQTLIAVGLVAMLASFVAIRSIWGWDFELFARAIISNVYLGFLLPLLCLCFGTQALGGDWEDRSLIWLLTRPLPRPALYLAKFVAAVPWTFGLTLGSLIVLGALAGPPGLQAVLIFWPAVAWGTLAYLSLFLLMGAWFRRSTVIAVVYAFVIEAIVGSMPGLVKRLSLAFYSRCLMYAEGMPGIAPPKSDLFLPVDGGTARLVLLLVSASSLVIGLVVFSRREYQDLT